VRFAGHECSGAGARALSSIGHRIDVQTSLTLATLAGMRTAFDASLGSFLAGAAVPLAPDAEEGTPRRRYRAVFISDLHLGTPGCQAAALLDFLKSHPSFS
jgi:hypothetical protein